MSSPKLVGLAGSDAGLSLDRRIAQAAGELSAFFAAPSSRHVIAAE
ncbi:hypothetical protein [Sinorhizobium meliloti]|nr:hypothetical protein [Sinorhizobium meliloti]